MNILEHPESHIVKLDDGSSWQIFPEERLTMRYREVELSVVQGIGRQLWKWSVSFDSNHSATGQAATKREAVAEAERAIDRALAVKKLRLVARSGK
jgi:hypothetical protein